MAAFNGRGGREALDRNPVLDAMTWPEIKALSQRIADAPSDGDALEIAKAYNLVDPSGRLRGAPVKTVELADGRAVDVKIIGFRHDKGTDGNARGITFSFADSVAFAPMAARRKHLLEHLEARRLTKAAEDLEALKDREGIASFEDLKAFAKACNSASPDSSANTGLPGVLLSLVETNDVKGFEVLQNSEYIDAQKALVEQGVAEDSITWENSDLREWLNEGLPTPDNGTGTDTVQSGATLLPFDLVRCVSPVSKQSVSGHLEEADVTVALTEDRFWILSTSEIFGSRDWYPGQSINDLVNAEGAQYQLFRDSAIDWLGANPVLYKSLIGNKKPQSCYWTRTQCSKSGNLSRFRYISGEGNALFKGGASYRHCVAPCFCV